MSPRRLPGTAGPTEPALLLVALNLGFVAVAVALGYRSTGSPDHHLKEHSVGTWVSFVQLLAIAGTAAVLARSRAMEARGNPAARGVGLWVVLAGAFAFLALDELTSIHEAIDKSLHRLVDKTPTSITDRLDDLIVGSYGLAGLALLYRNREELREFREVGLLCGAAFLALFAMVALDVFTDRPDLVRLLPLHRSDALELWKWLRAVEEGFKLVGASLFLATALACLRIARGHRVVPE